MQVIINDHCSTSGTRSSFKFHNGMVCSLSQHIPQQPVILKQSTTR